MKIPGMTHRHRVLIYSVVVLLILAAAGALTEIRSERFRALAGEFLASMCARRIEVGEASFNLLGRVTLRDVRIYNDTGYNAPLLFAAPIIRFQLGMTGGETSAFRPTRITILDPEIWFERDWTRTWNTDHFWVKKPPRTDHPTFALPIAIHGATIHLDDGRVGRSGFQMTFRDVKVNHTVMSDGAEITNNTAAPEIRLPKGGTMDLTLFTHPNARKAAATILFNEAEVTQLKPYYEFLRIISFHEGRLSGPIRIDFDSGVVSYDAEFRVAGPVLDHPASGARPRADTMTIDFKSITRDTRIEVASATMGWKRTRLDGRGIFSSKRAPDSFTSFTIETRDGRGEDIAFLLCDPSFEADGPVNGHSLLTGDTTGDRYAIEIDMTGAVARYGNIIHKAAGIHGRLAIEGRSRTTAARAGVAKISIEVSRSRAELVPENDHWKLTLPELHGSDVARHLTAFQDLPGFTLDGPVSAVFRLARGGGMSGSIDFQDASAEIEGWMKKPAGDPASLSVAGHFAKEKIRAENCEARIGKSRFHIDGEWAPHNADLDVKLDEILWNDVRKYFPGTLDQLSSYARLDGAASGQAALAQRGNAWAIRTTIRLDQTALDMPAAGVKPRGLGSSLSMNATFENKRLEIASGNIAIGNTDLGLSGHVSARDYDLALGRDRTGLDGLRTFLAPRLWPALSQIDITGKGDVHIAIKGADENVNVVANLNAKEAIMMLGDTWFKPAGEPFLISTRIDRSEKGTKIDILEVTQGSSSLSCEGTISADKPALIDANIKARIDVPIFLKRTPALERVQVGGRKASDSLKLIADDDQLVTLNGKLTGPLTQPKLSWLVEQMMTRVILNSLTRQLRAITSLFSAPVRKVTDLFSRDASSDTPVNRPENAPRK
ncbi:MAG: hypothetical protein AAB229_08940 [Candidatus Hydrogenedentota bacterium]